LKVKAIAQARIKREDQLQSHSPLAQALSHQGQVQALAKRLTQGLEVMDFQQRRELLHLLVDEIIYDE